MTPDPGASGGSAAEAKALTRFLMFEPFTDEECAQVGIPAGTGWKIVGTRDADSRDSAETGFYKDMHEPVKCSPVSENAWKPRITKPRVVQPRTREPLELDLSGLPSAAVPTTAAPPENENDPLAPLATTAPAADADLEVQGLAVDGQDIDELAAAELAEAEGPGDAR